MHDDQPNGTVTPDRALSILGGLRQEHAQVRRSKTKRIAVPGYGGKLVAEYQVIPWDDERELEKRAVKAGDHTRRELHYFMDQLIAACVQILANHEGQLVPLDEGTPVRWGDRRLAEGLGIDLPEAPTARSILGAVFAHPEADEARVPYLINRHHDRFIAWMAGDEDDSAASEAEDEYLGK